MIDAPDTSPEINAETSVEKTRARLARKRRMAAITLLVENLSAALWRTGSWLCLFGGLWLLQIPSMFGAAGPGIVLAAFILGLAWLIRNDLRAAGWPDRAAIDRRLESASQLAHRPLEIIDDRLANPDDPQTRILWQQQKAHAQRLIRKLRTPLPGAQIAGRDPYALRLATLLLFVIGLAAAGPRAADRIAHGLMPYPVTLRAAGAPPFMTLWIAPPAYTAQQRITLEGAGRIKTPLSIPAGSVLKARINSRLGQPVLHMNDRAIAMETPDNKSWSLEIPVEPGDIMRITQWGIPRTTIPYELLPDNPPAITIDGEPETMEKAELQFKLKLNDDYGVTEMTMDVALDPLVEDKPLGSPHHETRAVMSTPGTEQELKPLYDLGWHPWAGLPVEITFTARDFPGQETKTPPFKMVLPERAFRHPVAAELIALRKQLVWSSSAAAPEVAEKIANLMIRPQTYADDPRVFLSLRTMTSRLQYDPTTESVTAVIAQLWDTAIRIEDGNLPLAARELRAARAALEKLLADPNATPEEIATAVEKLRGAMGEYFRELAREIQKRLADGEMMAMSPELLESLMNPEDLASFMDQLQAQALTGDKDAARQMLSQLQQMMDNLNPTTGLQLPPEMQFMEEGISELQQLIEKQRALLDITENYFTDNPLDAIERTMPEFMPIDPRMFEQWGEDEAPPPPQRSLPPKAERSVNTERHKGEQEALRLILGQLMLEAGEKMGEIPETMGMAEQEMRLSAEQLGKNEPALSAPHQEKAIEYLQQSMQQMAQQMAQMMRQMMMLSLGPGKTDPLGRPMQEGNGPSWMPGSQVKIPDEAERKRVQEIQKILRDRVGERERPDYELDYFRRLLKQF